MLHALVMANDSGIADSIAAILAEGIDFARLRLAYRELGKGHRHSVVIILDEGDRERASIKLAEFFRTDIAVLVIKLSLNSRDVFVYEGYQLKNPTVERIMSLVRDFCATHLPYRS